MEIFLDNLKAFFSNYVLMTAILAWLVAQILKIFTGVYRDRHVNLSVLLFSTGGMPSSHSATVLGLTTAAALKDGFGSSTFAIAAILSIIVIIDACGVRYETGKQSKMLNKIVQEMFTDTENAETHFKEFIGHTPLQVFVGAMLGIIVGIVMFFVFY
jgi:acid phosphatase family membrane protein YuiD